MKLIHNLSITPFTRKHEERERESGMGRRGPAPGQGGRPARDPAIKRAWERLLERVVVPRVVRDLKAKGTWVMVREHIKGAGKKCRAEHTGGAYWGSNFDPRKRDIAVKRAQEAGKTVFDALPAEQRGLMPPRFNWGVVNFINRLKRVGE